MEIYYRAELVVSGDWINESKEKIKISFVSFSISITIKSVFLSFSIKLCGLVERF